MWTGSDARHSPRPQPPLTRATEAGRVHSGSIPGSLRTHAHPRAPAVGHVASVQGFRSRKCPGARVGGGNPLVVARRRSGTVSGADASVGTEAAWGRGSGAWHRPARSASAPCGKRMLSQSGAGRATREAPRNPRPSRTPGPLAGRTPPPGVWGVRSRVEWSPGPCLLRLHSRPPDQGPLGLATLGTKKEDVL